MVIVWWQLLLVIVLSYLFGNLTFARFIAKSKHTDISKLGSGNPGSTNILRNFGFKLGFINL
ncbi:MAG: glycerol-3-phosphate acyltransferase, partial [Clostridia bacterium]